MKTVLLTGASGGLGQVLAKDLLKKGYFVILLSFKHEESSRKIHKKYLNQSLSFSVNLTEEEEIKNLKKELEKQQRKVDILINNAAIDHVSDLEEKNEDTFLKVFKLNTLGPFYMIKYFGEEIDSQKGVILNISSDNTIDKYDVVTLEYDISKSGLNLMTKSFADYYKNTKINAIAFGWLDTPMNDIPENIKETMDFVPLKVASQKIIEMIETNETGKIEIVR